MASLFFCQGVGMNHTKDNKFELWNTRLAVIIPALTALTFITGSLWADFYFKQFHINFLKSSGFTGAFQFVFSNMKLVALSITSATIYYLLIMLLVFTIFKWLEKLRGWIFRKSKKNIEEKEEDRPLTPFEKWFIFLFLTGAVFFSTTIIFSATTEKIAQKIRFSIKTKAYEAVTIHYANPMPTDLKCAYQLGSIGNFNAYISMSLETYLIKESAITSIRYPFSTFRTTSEKTRKENIKENWNKLCS
jgi:Ca2+/Na+ antiporter